MGVIVSFSQEPHSGQRAERRVAPVLQGTQLLSHRQRDDFG